MRRLVVALGAVAVVAGSLGLATTSGAATNHALSATIRAADVAQSRNNVTIAGVVTGRPLGEGGAVAHLRIVSATRTTGRFTVWYGKGSFHGTVSYTLKPGANNTVSFTGAARVTGGTGKFAGATGSFTSTGKQASNGQSTQHVRGTLRY